MTQKTHKQKPTSQVLFLFQQKDCLLFFTYESNHPKRIGLEEFSIGKLRLFKKNKVFNAELKSKPYLNPSLIWTADTFEVMLKKFDEFVIEEETVDFSEWTWLYLYIKVKGKEINLLKIKLTEQFGIDLQNQLWTEFKKYNAFKSKNFFRLQKTIQTLNEKVQQTLNGLESVQQRQTEKVNEVKRKLSALMAQKQKKIRQLSGNHLYQWTNDQVFPIGSLHKMKEFLWAVFLIHHKIFLFDLIVISVLKFVMLFDSRLHLKDFFKEINLQAIIMRKNKFVNPFQHIPFSPVNGYTPVKSPSKLQHGQNKFYFPTSQFDKFMPYQIEFSNSNYKKPADKMHSSELYSINEKPQIKQKSQRKPSFRREKKFQKVQAEKTNDQTENKSKSLIKYNTWELRNLKGVNFTFSGTTIYRSKNVKSVGKFNFQETPTKQGNSEISKNLSIKNEESCKSSLSKSKNRTQQRLKLKDKKMVLYEEYFQSKPGIHYRNNSHNSKEKWQVFGEEGQKLVQNAQDILCRSIIEAQIYGNLEAPNDQQYF